LLPHAREQAVRAAARLIAIAAVMIGDPAEGTGPIPFVFDWSSYRSLATGSDNWPLTWCEDDHQYTSWGDGGGFGGSNSEGRVSLGFGRVSGTYSGLQTLNLWGGDDPVADATFPGKVTSMLCLGGRLYAWRSPGSEEAAFDFKQLVLSEDKGVTWQEDAFPQSRMEGCVGCPGIPYVINYGRNYAANTDGYVYTYWIKIQDPTIWDVQIPGVIWLMRAPAADEAFTDAANWEWFTGFDESQNPQWGVMEDRAPVLEDPDGVLHGSAIYVPGIDLFLMSTNHTQFNGGAVAFWSAPAPWGPWSLTSKFFDWPFPVTAPRYILGHFSPKWFSEDGLGGVFVWFGPDRWSSAKFNVPEPSGPSLWLASALALGACSAASARGATSEPSRRPRSGDAVNAYVSWIIKCGLSDAFQPASPPSVLVRDGR
jgi:hypothetical protein